MPAISNDDLWCDTVKGPAKTDAASPFSKWQLANINVSIAVNPLSMTVFSPMKQRSMLDAPSTRVALSMMKLRARTSIPTCAPRPTVPFSRCDEPSITQFSSTSTSRRKRAPTMVLLLPTRPISDLLFAACSLMSVAILSATAARLRIIVMRYAVCAVRWRYITAVRPPFSFTAATPTPSPKDEA